MIRVIDGLLALVFVFMLFFVATCAVVFGQPRGFELRGIIETATSDGSGYFKIGDTLILMVPRDSALLPGIRSLEGKKIVIKLQEDIP